MKLRTKIQVFASLFMLILMLLINTSIYYLFYRISADNDLEQLESQTETIVSALNKNPDIAENALLRAYVPADGMIRVIKETGEPFMILRKPDAETELPSEFSSSGVQEVIKWDSEASIAVIKQPIIWDDGNVVTLEVSKQLVGLHETMTTLLYVVIVASILMLIPSILGGRALSTFLLRPINKFIQTMRENTTQENWRKIDLQGRSKDELYQMEVTFNEMIDHLKANFQKQEQFVSDASHELKTPIAIVKSYAELLKRRGQERPEVFQEAVSAIDSEADRMQQLVEQMLLLAKNENETSLETVNFVMLCKKAVAHFIGAYGRSIDLAIDADNIYVQANRDQLKQIIYILIDNAIKYSDDVINVSISQQDLDAVLQVQDFGPGIPEAQKDKIFDRFYRVDKARSRDTGGTGLGLAIAKAIVDIHDGVIDVETSVGNGSTFIVKLPLVKK